MNFAKNPVLYGLTENASRTPAAGLNGSLKMMSELGTDLRTQTYQVTENASRTPAAGLKGSPLIMSVLGTKHQFLICKQTICFKRSNQNNQSNQSNQKLNCYKIN